MKLSVIGLGKLGSCSAACFAYRGFEVVGVDLNQDFVNAINNLKAPVVEPRLQELIEGSKGRLRATTDFKDAFENSDVTFLIVPTPSKEDGNFSDKYLKDALKQLALAYKESKKSYHVFVITSTVSPGTTDRELIPHIETYSGKKLNQDFGVCYNPEFIALGNIIYNFLNPDMLLIGESDKKAGDMVSGCYEKMCENDPYYARMSLVSAEVTKISLNSYVTTKISFANTLSNICERIPGTNIDDITKALGADRRISPYYLKGGMGYGGTCFPRDNRAFAAFAKEYGVDAIIAKATDKVNQLQVDNLIDIVLKHSRDLSNKHAAVLGVAFKPDTPVIEESGSVKVVEKLLEKGFKVTIYDELAMENAKMYFGTKVNYSGSINECMKEASICLVTTQTNEFKAITESCFSKNTKVVVDCWRILDTNKIDIKKRKYISLGKYAG